MLGKRRHNPSENNAYNASVRMRVDEFDEYVAMVSRAREAWAGRVDVRLGVESDFLPGTEPWLERLYAQANLSYILGSVHPMTPEFKARYLDGSVLEFQQTYFELLAQAAESGLFNALSHPDLVKIEFPDQWDLSRVLDDVRRALDRIAVTGVALELNTSGLHKPYAEMNPGAEYLAEMHKRGIPVVLGSDAHGPERVAADFERALETLESVGYKQVSYFLDQQRHDVAIRDALASLIPA